jgi:hypothetical protein
MYCTVFKHTTNMIHIQSYTKHHLHFYCILLRLLMIRHVSTTYMLNLYQILNVMRRYCILNVQYAYMCVLMIRKNLLRIHISMYTYHGTYCVTMLPCGNSFFWYAYNTVVHVVHVCIQIIILVIIIN